MYGVLYWCRLQLLVCHDDWGSGGSFVFSFLYMKARFPHSRRYTAVVIVLER